MEYNTSRSKMNISEYGRNIQKMIEYIMSFDDREKRNQLTRATINVMGQLNPHLRDVNDFKHKLWDHLFIMSDFKLDVDSPYPIPSANILTRKPERLEYASNNITFKHYGRHIERMIEKAVEFEEGPEKDMLIKLIANHMKKSYLTWNRDAVTDEEIASHLNKLSKGRLQLSENVRLSAPNEVQQPRQPQKPRKKFQHKAPGNKGYQHKGRKN
ncbi:MAG: DUF4290 domain-containing protein [Bacteroidales bacterium]